MTAADYLIALVGSRPDAGTAVEKLQPLLERK